MIVSVVQPHSLPDGCKLDVLPSYGMLSRSTVYCEIEFLVGAQSSQYVLGDIKSRVT